MCFRQPFLWITVCCLVILVVEIQIMNSSSLAFLDQPIPFEILVFI